MARALQHVRARRAPECRPGYDSLHELHQELLAPYAPPSVLINESTFATVRLRQRVTKEPGSRATGIAMAFKRSESAQHRWRAVNSAHLVRWSEPARRSRTASSSNDPTNQRAVTLTPHDTLIHRP